MVTHDKELPPIPLRSSQPQASGHPDAMSDPCRPRRGVHNSRERENEELRETNKRLQYQLRRLTVENSNLLDWKKHAEEEMEYHREIIEIQKGALKDIMAHTVTTTQHCRMSVKREQTERERGQTGHASLSRGTDTPMI
ncbi:hypothetical protein NCS52_00875200 [Fusarium sp. LHS14.1]|nr:hypothetical protein NCS52_00875200 [Fusarium sp. LHS14.1]